MLILTSLFLLKNIYTQNLILNPSFESTTNYNCQGSFYDIVGGSPTFGAHLLDNWYQYNSPDYFNSLCGAGGYSVPNSYFGYSFSKQGDSHVGIYIYIKMEVKIRNIFISN